MKPRTPEVAEARAVKAKCLGPAKLTLGQYDNVAGQIQQHIPRRTSNNVKTVKPQSSCPSKDSFTCTRKKRI